MSLLLKQLFFCFIYIFILSILFLFRSGECRHPTGPRCVEMLVRFEQILVFLSWRFPVNADRFFNIYKPDKLMSREIAQSPEHRVWPFLCRLQQPHLITVQFDPQVWCVGFTVSKFEWICDDYLLDPLLHQLEHECDWDLRKIVLHKTMMIMMNKLHRDEEPMPLNIIELWKHTFFILCQLHHAMMHFGLHFLP